MDTIAVDSANGYMTTPPRNLISFVRKARGMSQAELAQKVGAHWVTISKLERGKMQLTQDWMYKLSSALDVPYTELFDYNLHDYVEISVDGLINYDGKINKYKEPELYKLEEDKHSSPLGTWYRIGEDAGYPIFRDGDLIRFVPVDECDAQHYVGRLVHANTVNVDPENDNFEFIISTSIMGFLEFNSTEQRFDLRTLTGKPYRNISVKWLMAAFEVRYRMPWS